MGGGHGTDSPVVQEVEDGDSQGCAFRGIRARAELIEKAEGIGVRIFQDGNDGGHVRREGTQALLNTLFIADICINFTEDGQLRTIQGGNMKACLTHKAEKAGCF